MRSPIWFYLFWSLIILLGSYFLIPKLIGQNKDIKNAFYDLENNMDKSNKITSKAIDGTIEGITPILDKKPFLRVPLKKGINDAKIISDSFCKELDDIKIALTAACLIKDKDIISDQDRFDKIIKNSSIETIKIDGKELSRKDESGKITISRDKDWTTYLMVKLNYGDELEKRVSEVRNEFINAYEKAMKGCQKGAELSDEDVADKIEEFKNKIPLRLDESWKTRSSKNTWAEAYFDHMPYAACMPILEKFKADAKACEAIFVNDLAKLLGGKPEVNYDKLFPLMNAKSGNIKKGGVFEAQVAIGALSTPITKTSSITVNGLRVSMNKDGIGVYKETCNNIGKRELKIEATCRHPLTGEILRANSTYEYMVTE